MLLSSSARWSRASPRDGCSPRGAARHQQDQLRDTFQALAASTLKASTDEFLKLADQKIGNVHREAAIDLTRRQQELGTLVTPIRDTLVQVDAKLKEVEKTRIDDSASMKSLLNLVGHTQQQLQQETQNLVRALRSPGVRGQWGEVQLRKVVELAGMMEHCDFDQQPTIFTEGGRLRPDMTINLPGGRTIVVDAKAPLEAFLDAQSADRRWRAQRQAGRSRAAGARITSPSSAPRRIGMRCHPRRNWSCCSCPAEAIYMAALERDASLIDYGVKQNVLIASPLTLIALLRAAAFGWRQERLTINAEEISRLGRALHESVATMAEHLEDLRAPDGRHVPDLQQGGRLVREQRAGQGAAVPRARRRQRQGDPADRSARNRRAQARCCRHSRACSIKNETEADIGRSLMTRLALQLLMAAVGSSLERSASRWRHRRRSLKRRRCPASR